MLYPLSVGNAMNLFLLALTLAAAPMAQTSVDLKLNLRENETVKYRNVYNVVTYSPEKIDERVQNSLMTFTFGPVVDGKIPVKALIEEYEGMDLGSNSAGPAMKLINLNFNMTRKGVAEDVKHSTSNPALEPVGILLRKTLAGMNSIGFLGLTMPEKTVSVGDKWSQKVSAASFLAPALAPAGDAFKVTGIYDVVFTLVDVTPVNGKRHARISVTVNGTSDLEINSPEFSAGGSLTLSSESSILVDLETGLISSSKTDTSADIVIGEASAQIVTMSLLYRKVS